MAAGTTAVSISLDGRFENFYHSHVVGADAFREDRVFPRSAKKLPGRLLMDEPAMPRFSAADPSSPRGGEAASPWPDWRCILLLVLLTLAMRDLASMPYRGDCPRYADLHPNGLAARAWACQGSTARFAASSGLSGDNNGHVVVGPAAGGQGPGLRHAIERPAGQHGRRGPARHPHVPAGPRMVQSTGQLLGHALVPVSARRGARAGRWPVRTAVFAVRRPSVYSAARGRCAQAR